MNVSALGRRPRLCRTQHQGPQHSAEHGLTYIHDLEFSSDCAEGMHACNSAGLWQMKVAQCLLQESQPPYQSAVVQFPFETMEM